MARFSAPVQTGPGTHPASCTMGTGSFPGGKERLGRDAETSPPSSTVGHERVELYLYSPFGPYGLYRASVPVQGCTVPLPYYYIYLINSLNAESNPICHLLALLGGHHILHVGRIRVTAKIMAHINLAGYHLEEMYSNVWLCF